MVFKTMCLAGRCGVSNGMVMTNSNDYRMYLELSFKTVNEKLDRIEQHVKETNGTVKEHEERIDCLEERNKIDDEIKKTFWRRYKRTIEIVGVLVAFATLFYMNQSNKVLIKDVKQDVETTNTYIAPTRSFSPYVRKDTINESRP